jgi:hypothetical protein
LDRKPPRSRGREAAERGVGCSRDGVPNHLGVETLRESETDVRADRCRRFRSGIDTAIGSRPTRRDAMPWSYDMHGRVTWRRCPSFGGRTPRRLRGRACLSTCDGRAGKTCSRRSCTRSESAIDHECRRLPVGVTSLAEGREPNAQVAHGEAVQVPGAATRDLLGLGSEQPGELPLEAQPRVLPDDALADCIGYLVAA